MARNDHYEDQNENHQDTKNTKDPGEATSEGSNDSAAERIGASEACSLPFVSLW
jgi:hypothetical protein